MKTASWPESIDRIEAERLERREELKLRVEHGAAIGSRIAELDAELAEIDATITAIEDEHSETTGPVQAALKSLDADAVERIAAREPVDAEDEKRRTQLIEQIATANDNLELAIKRANRRRAPLLDQRSRLTRESQSMPMRELLANRDVAKPELLAVQHCAHQRHQFAAIRLAAAKKALSVAERIGGHREMLARAEVSASEQEVSAASQAAAQAYENVIEE